MIRQILIIDDSPIARKILRSCMPGDRSFEFSEAGDGQPKTIERVMTLGAFDMRKKPPSRETLSNLLSRVETHLRSLVVP